MKRALILVAIAGCASGSAKPGDASVTDAKTIDGGESFVDAAIDAPLIDAPPIDAPMIDAPMIDAPILIDAPMIDAPPDACVPVVTELLVNPVFDLSPVGTGWQQTLIHPAAPLVTGDDGIAEHTAPYKAWLGGIEAETASVTDVLWQDVTVPAGTTQLVLTGYYEVRTSETTAILYDTASFDLTMTNGTPIQNLRSLSNLTPTTAWTAITHTFTQNLAGQTVRLRMTSSNDFLNVTNFFFDTLSLRATHCP